MATKIKKITTDDGYILTQYPRNNSITFFAKLPEYAVIKTIKIDGIFIEDFKDEKNIEYHRNRVDGDCRDICTIYFDEKAVLSDEMQKLIKKIDSYVIQEFEVYYEEEAVIRVE